MTQINSPIERTSVKFCAAFAQATAFENWWQAHQQKQGSFPIGLAMVGRSNVGKSTMLNYLFRNDIARVSKTPGKTKEINVFEFALTASPAQTFFVFDLPGHGHAEVSHAQKRQWDELLGTFFPLVATWCLGVVIQDARHLAQPTDVDFMHYMHKQSMELILVANKYDLLKNQKERHAFEKEFRELSRRSRWSAVFTCAQNSPALQATLAQYLGHFCLRKLMAQDHSPGSAP